MTLDPEMMAMNVGPGDDNYGRDRPIAWPEYETIACHPKFPERLRIIRHPNGPALVHGPYLCTVGGFIRQVGEALGPIEAGDYAEWIAHVLAGAAQDVSAPRQASNVKDDRAAASAAPSQSPCWADSENMKRNQDGSYSKANPL